MKKALDILSVTILAVASAVGLYWVIQIASQIPANMWIKVGARFGTIGIVILVIWGFIRGSKVLDDWYQEAKRKREREAFRQAAQNGTKLSELGNDGPKSNGPLGDEWSKG